MPEDQNQAALRIWRRHEQRRRDGLPTVSLLLVDEGNELGMFEAALAVAGHELIASSASEPNAMAREWMQGIASEHDVLDAAFAFVARELGEPERELRASWAARSDWERRLWLDQCSQHALPALDAALLSLRGALEVVDDEPMASLVQLQTLMTWLPQAAHLVFTLERGGPAGLRALLSVAADAPEWAFLAVVGRAAWTSIREQLESRARTLLDASVLPMDWRPSMVPRDPETLRVETAIRPVDDLRERTATAAERARAARESSAPEAAALDSRARSLAEQRLFELLQADSVTRGLFELNRRLPFTFGRSRAEVDLVCLDLRLAVEVDGYYHFQEWTAYRRDRRKDVLLQHQGYLVSRHLATDVVERAGEVLRAIRELVLRRRRSLRRENAT